jgi:hypothetical protein
MRFAPALLVALLTAAVVGSDLRAVILDPTAKDIERALKLAQAREPQRAPFHASYIVHVSGVVEQIEVITEFRRYVLTTEDELRMGNWLFAQSPERAREKIKPWRGRLTLSARLRFHPQNTLIGVPPYEVAIADPDLPALEITRTPLNALLSGKRDDRHAPLIGAVVDAVFAAASVGQAVRVVRLSLRGETIATTTIDFSRLE